MLRSPLESLARHRWATAGVVVALAASIWLVAALGAAVVQIQQGAVAWWDQFYPVVYLESGVDAAEVEHLHAEIQNWSEVASVEVESAQAMKERLEAQFGADEVRAMGVEASMMPTALVVQPSIWRSGQEELVARLEAMKVRQSVMDVEAPAAGALSWMERGRSVAAGVAVAVFAVFGASLVALVSVLRRLQHRNRRENHLLEVFGATPEAIRRSTWLRGMALGTVSGVVAAMGFLPWSLAVDGFVADVAGTGAMSATTSALWSAALIGAGWALGTGVGWGCSRPPRGRTGRPMESLLEWEDEAT